MIHTSNGLTYTITQDGLTTISDGSTTYAQGGIYLWDGRDYHNLNRSQSFHSEPLSIEKTNYDTFYTSVQSPILAKSITELSSTGVKVVHTYTDLSVEYTYTLSSDIKIDVKVINDSNNQITCPVVGGLEVTFPSTPSGLAYKGTPLHPSTQTYTYCGYLQTNSFGVSLTSLGVKNEKCLAHFDYNNNPNVRTLEYHLRRFVWPRSTETWSINLKAMLNPTFSGLLTQYKTDLLTQHGARHYNIDNRKWLIGSVISSTGTNPYGLLNSARLDSNNGMLIYMSGLKADLGSTGRGAVIYDLTGYSTNPLPYEVWPLPITDNVWDFNVQFMSGGYTPGILADFHLQPIRSTYTQDENLPLWPVQEPGTPDTLNQASNWNLIDYKFNRVNDYEFGIYYVPNFGTYESALTVQKIRPQTSGSIYVGQGCDFVGAYAGFHTKADYNGSWETRTPREFFNLMRYVYGDVDVYCEQANVTGVPPSFPTFALSNRMSCWTKNSGEYAAIRTAQTGYISNGQFI